MLSQKIKEIILDTLVQVSKTAEPLWFYGIKLFMEDPRLQNDEGFFTIANDIKAQIVDNPEVCRKRFGLWFNFFESLPELLQNVKKMEEFEERSNEIAAALQTILSAPDAFNNVNRSRFSERLQAMNRNHHISKVGFEYERLKQSLTELFATLAPVGCSTEINQKIEKVFSNVTVMRDLAVTKF